MMLLVIAPGSFGSRDGAAAVHRDGRAGGERVGGHEQDGLAMSSGLPTRPTGKRPAALANIASRSAAAMPA